MGFLELHSAPLDLDLTPVLLVPNNHALLLLFTNTEARHLSQALSVRPLPRMQIVVQVGFKRPAKNMTNVQVFKSSFHLDQPSAGGLCSVCF